MFIFFLYSSDLGKAEKNQQHDVVVQERQQGSPWLILAWISLSSYFPYFFLFFFVATLILATFVSIYSLLSFSDYLGWSWHGFPPTQNFLLRLLSYTLAFRGQWWKDTNAMLEGYKYKVGKIQIQCWKDAPHTSSWHQRKMHCTCIMLNQSLMPSWRRK